MKAAAVGLAMSAIVLAAAAQPAPVESASAGRRPLQQTIRFDDIAPAGMVLLQCWDAIGIWCASGMVEFVAKPQLSDVKPKAPGPIIPCRSAPLALFFSKLAPYIGGAGSPAMEINGRRNKPFGPGGSTRRLHPSPPQKRGFRRGRNRIDEGVKGVFFLGMVPPLSGYAIVANDNYAPVAQAA